MNEAARRSAEPPGCAPLAAALAARTSYGRLLALLASRSRDIAAAEDALAEALATALAVWPARGVPDNPDAWLLTAARRNIGRARARGATAARESETMQMLQDERDAAGPLPFGDDRLKLLFVCTHPAIAADVQAPLMLQTVLGLDAARIAASFLVSPAAMGQKLVRAKRRIRDAGIAFQVPDAAQLPARLAAVLQAIYAAFGNGWDDLKTRDGLTSEAIWLARLLCELQPEQPEAIGLLALMLHCEARRPARRDAAGAFVPLSAQDPQRWDAAMLHEAEALLRFAACFGTPGRFQLEAAIQSLHAERVLTGADHGTALLALHDLLLRIAPSAGAAVARAAVLAETDPAAALDALAALTDRCADYQPWWATRAHVLRRLGDGDGARVAARAAADRTGDAAVRHYLLATLQD
ncbi:MAG: RNA polymerase subunit sigma-70 [Alphaproteobacteria bacterium PA4]|nr:MAG: RNA polymerase subunit sigma-70 [Alphaproteobacteria bacterium PA4]